MNGGAPNGTRPPSDQGVADRDTEPAVLSVASLLDHLERALEIEIERVAGAERIVAFDGDGTLWDGDVGVALFEALLDRGTVHEEAAVVLAAEARRFAIPVPEGGGPLPTARALHAAFFDGRYPDELAYAMHAWVFAGWPEADVEALAVDVLRAFSIDDRIHGALLPLFDWAARRGVEAMVVSASPVWIVRAAAGRFGLPVNRVLAMSPIVSAGVVEPRLAEPITYGEGKLAAIRAARPAATLLAAFGDGAWDAAMLRAARVPVAVRPGAALLEIAPTIPGLAVLEV